MIAGMVISMRYLRAVLLLLPVPLAARGRNWSRWCAKSSAAVVRIETDDGLGSGAIISDRGFVLTNFHVVNGATKVTVVTRGGKSVAAAGFLVAEPRRDLAVLKIEPLAEAKPLKIAEALPQIGERVAAFGNPRGFSFSTSEGIVSAIRPGREIAGVIGAEAYHELGYDDDATWVQTTAPISPGNSGGPLVNMNVELVGLNTWTSARGQNLNFAISATDIKRIVQSAEKARLKTFAKLPKPSGQSDSESYAPGAGKIDPATAQALVDRCLEMRQRVIATTDELIMAEFEEIQKAKAAPLKTSRVKSAMVARREKEAAIAERAKTIADHYKTLVKLRLGKELMLPLLNPQFYNGDVGSLVGKLRSRTDH